MELLIHFSALPEGLDLEAVKLDLATVLEDDGWLTGSGPDFLELELEDERANPKYGILTVKGDRQKAKDGFERMIRTYPEIPEPYNNLAGIYSREGNLTRAEELLVKALALRPNFALAHMNLGNLYLAKAKNAYNSAIKTGGNKEKLNANIRAIDKLLAD